MLCGRGGSLRHAKERGNVPLTNAKKTDLGVLVFYIAFVPAAWVAENSDRVSKFLKVTVDTNAM